MKKTSITGEGAHDRMQFSLLFQKCFGENVKQAKLLHFPSDFSCINSCEYKSVSSNDNWCLIFSRHELTAESMSESSHKIQALRIAA